MDKWNSSIQFPTDNCFQDRILKANFSPSNKGNPQIALELEVIAPTIYNISGVDVDISGVKARQYMGVTIMDLEDKDKIDMEKTKKARKRVTTFFKSMGIEVGEVDADGVSTTLDWNNLDVKQLEGKICFCKMSSDVVEQRKTPTQAQLEKAKKEGVHPNQAGDIMKHPMTGKKLVDYWPQIDEIYGAVPA
jgi:hypothetical protein